VSIFSKEMLLGQCAVVTGGGRGIGRSIALALAEVGADVAVINRSASDMAQETVEQISALDRKAILYSCNVADYDATEETVKQVAADFGRIDILINNAGITKDSLLAQMQEADFDSVVETNLKGTFHMMRHASRLMMRRRYGRIVNISSVAGLMGNGGQVNYAASKAGVIGMTKSAAKELASRGITVNAIAPGFIRTDMTKNLADNLLVSATPAGRMGEAEEVAALTVFLCSSAAAYITGEVIRVDGGLGM